MTAASTPLSFAQCIAAHHHLQSRRMRLLLRRRVGFLRSQWAENKLVEPGLYVGDAQADRLLKDDAYENEWRFYVEDAKAREIGRELVEVEGELKELTDAARQAGRWLPLDHLARLFSLDAFERDVVAMCMALELDGALEKLFAYVQDDVSRRAPTPALAIALFGAARQDTDCMRAFLPNGVLRQYGLLRPADASSLAALPLRLTERVTAYLQGVEAPEEEVTALLRPVAPAPLTARQQDSASQVGKWLAQSGAAGRWPRVNLYGAPEAGKRATARAICDANGLALHELDLLKLGNNGRDLLRGLERECLLSNWALYIEAALLTELADAPLIRTIDSLLEKLRTVIFLGSRVAFRTDRPLVSVAVPEPGAEERADLWRQALARIPNSAEAGVEALAEHYAFGPGTIVRIVAEAGEHARLEGDQDITERGLREVCRRQAGQAMGSTAHRVEPKQTWTDLIVPDDIRAQLQDILAQARNRHHVYRGWEFGRKLSRGMGISVLFAGPSGTGKTMAAEVMAYELGLDLYRIDLATVVSKYIGETEKNLRSVFDGAERSGAILFFDEADALFGKRTEVSDSHDRYANIEIDYLLQRMEDYNGLAVLATNMKGNMDQAFLRRLRFVVEFPFPDAALRERIWRGSFPKSAPLDGIRWDVLSRLEVPGGNIRNISLNAAFLAAAEGSPIGMEHLMSAARREYLKEEKLVTPGEFGEHFGRLR